MQGPADSREPLELAPESAPAPDRIRQLHPGGPPHGYAGQEAPAPEPEPKSGKGESKPDLLSRFMVLPRWEQYVGASALVCLLGWLGASGWASFLSLGSPGGWFLTFALIGPVAVTFLIIAGTGPSRWIGMSDQTRKRSIGIFAMLPVVGGLIELLQNFWAAVALVSAVAMAYAAFRLLTDKSDDDAST